MNSTPKVWAVCDVCVCALLPALLLSFSNICKPQAFPNSKNCLAAKHALTPSFFFCNTVQEATIFGVKGTALVQINYDTYCTFSEHVQILFGF